MTRVVCSIAGYGAPLSFECAGHAGNRAVCAECSALCAMLVRYADEKGHAPAVCEDGHIKIEISRSSTEINAVFHAAMLEFKALAQRFGEHIEVCWLRGGRNDFWYSL